MCTVSDKLPEDLHMDSLRKAGGVCNPHEDEMHRIWSWREYSERVTSSRSGAM
ncbi:hypothetical protein M407DRAFT_241877 [Tulasnella calospora MUT 4182]|uniref:Uncharacterized protein n=1 Tax=Tulasnella calospora MUT 4182 TaxID=1051891 RepID=A0A0C3QR64_9AGAM|nr:hypothetical protein M407DRAFT_241877 [Tulasnella calospora MUT 4182]